MILLDSVFINNSGGKVLLDYLIQELYNSRKEVHYLLDIRCKGSYPFLPENAVTYLPPSLKQRHLFFKENKSSYNKILCFNNVPPTVKTKATVYVYFHNVLFLETPKNYPFVQKIKKAFKGLIVNHFLKNVDYFIVQSENVKSMLLKRFNIPSEDCLIIPFYPEKKINPVIQSKSDNIYFYVSDGNPHKNHKVLLKAWEILNQKGHNYQLLLTITNNYPKLIKEIETYIGKGVNIINLGFVDTETLYSKARYMLYPSLVESFGLGIIEAVDSGCEIITSNLPYAKAIAKPLAIFDPHSPESIVDAILKNRLTTDRQISEKKVKNEIEKLTLLLEEKN